MKNPASAKGKERDNRKIVSHREKPDKLNSLWLILCIGAAFFLPPPAFGQPEATQTMLDNGITVLLKENRDLPLVSLCLYVSVGAAEAGKYTGTGIAHFAEHMVFKGSEKRLPGEAFREIESFGGTLNAYTSYDYTGYNITVPSKFVYPALEVLADLIKNPVFPAEELLKEKEVVLKEIRLSQDDPQRYASRLLWQTAYSSHPYKYPILGEESLFNSLTREDLLEFYQRFYIPANIALVIAGDIEQRRLLPAIKKRFEDFPAGHFSRIKNKPEPLQRQLRNRQEKFSASLTYLLLGFHSVSLTDQDCLALDVLAAILGEGKSSRMYRLICDQKRLAYSLQAINYTPRDPGLFIVSSLLEEDKRNRALSLILQQIGLVRKRKVSEAELEAAKAKIISGILFYNQSVEAQAEDLAINQALAGDYNFTERYIQGIKNVGAKDVLKVARRYLKRENLNIVALVPRDQSARTGQGPPAESGLTIGVENLSREQMPDPAIKSYVLANGLKVLIKGNKRLPLISIKAVFQGGLRAEDENTNGLSNLAVLMLDKGTKTKTASKIADLVESRGARLSSFSGNNSFGLSLDLLSEDFNEMLALFADLIVNPAFPEEEFKKQKEKCLAEIKAEADDIFASGENLLKSKLFLRHPYKFSQLGSEQSLASLRRRDLEQFYQKFCTGKNMVLAIFGDLNADDALSSVKEYFSEISGADPVNILPPSEPKAKRVSSAVQRSPKKQTLLLLGFYGATVFDQERPALELVCQILSRASGRLFTRIREEQGLAYTLGAYPVLGIDPGFIVIYAATTAEHIETVKKTILEELGLLKEKPLTEQELAQAKSALIGRKLISRQTNSACALESALDELYGLGFDHYLKQTAMIEAVTAEEIKRCAEKYFDLGNYAVVTIGPDK